MLETLIRVQGGSLFSEHSKIKACVAAFSCIFVFEGRASNREARSLAQFSLNLAQGRHVWLGQLHDEICIPLIVEFDG